jgi:hypothetical protein
MEYDDIAFIESGNTILCELITLPIQSPACKYKTITEKPSQPMDIEEEGGMVQMVTLGMTILTYQFVEK